MKLFLCMYMCIYLPIALAATDCEAVARSCLQSERAPQVTNTSDPAQVCAAVHFRFACVNNEGCLTAGQASLCKEHLTTPSNHTLGSNCSEVLGVDVDELCTGTNATAVAGKPLFCFKHFVLVLMLCTGWA